LNPYSSSDYDIPLN